METSSQVLDNLVSQIEEEYGKLVYTFTCHLKQSRIYSTLNSVLSWTDIILTAVTAGSLLGLLFTDEKTLAIISAICAAFSLMINLFQKDAHFGEKVTEHKSFAQKLWLPREQYLSILTDVPVLEIVTIQERRDSLLKAVNDLYSVEPMTSNIAYRMAKKALKNNEEQFFSRDELNQLLPEGLRHQ